MLLPPGASAEPAPVGSVTVVAPPSADAPALVEAGLLMQSEASRALLELQPELHVKQLLRSIERHRLTPQQLTDPAIAARVRSLLGAGRLVISALTDKGGTWQLEIRTVDEKGASPPKIVALPTSLPAAIDAGAQALAAAADPKVKPPSLGTTSSAAAQGYATCYAILIRQPISIESPTLLSPSEIERAVQTCRTAVAADPKLEPAAAALGLALAFAGKDSEAVQALLKVRPRERYEPLYWLARYWLVTRYQSPDAGVLALREALHLHPGFWLARGYLAEHLTITGKYEEALVLWKEYAALLPKNAFLQGRVSSTLARLGRIDESIAVAKAALELDRSDPDAVLELGSRYLDAGKHDEAIAILQTAVSGKARGELFLRLGWAHFGRGDLIRAESLFHRAEEAATSPGEWRTRARARADLARVCDRRGDKACATIALERAIDEGTAAYLRNQRDRRLVELVKTVEKAPRKSKGPRVLRPAELSPFTIDPAGEVDVKPRQFPQPPPQFELLRF